MTYRITFALDLFNGEEERELSRRALNHMLNILYKIDCEYLASHPKTPRLYQSGIRYMEEPPGQEDWQDIPTTLRMGMGDCLPLSTLVMREDGKSSPLGELKVGDRIIGHEGKPTTVLEGCATGRKPILDFYFESGHESKRKPLRCTPEHRIILHDGDDVRAKDVLIGQSFRSLEMTARVRAIHTSGSEECGDIKTDSGVFYLPESDVIVHNCEDLACWRAAELTVRDGILSTPFFREQRRSNGSYLYHILVKGPPTAKYPQGQVEDPSKILGMR